MIQTVCAIAAIDVGAFGHPAAQALDLSESGCQRVAIIGIAGQRQHAEYQSLAIGRGHRDLDAELVALVRLAFGQTLDLRCVQCIELGMIRLLLREQSGDPRQRLGKVRSESGTPMARNCVVSRSKRRSSGPKWRLTPGGNAATMV